MRWSRSDLWAVVFLAALVLSLVGPALLGRASFPPGDFVDQFYAFARFAAQELAHGRLPLWNPYTFSGHPFLADIQSGVFYPPNLVMLLLAARAGGDLPLWALYAQVALHLWLAGVFTYLFARDRLGDRWAALLAALAFALGGYLTSYPVLQLAVLQTDTWLPLLLWLVDKGLGNRDLGLKESSAPGLNVSSAHRQPSIPIPYSLFPLAVLALAWAMTLLPGHPQSVMYVGYAVLAWAVYRAWALGVGGWRGLVTVGGAALWGLGLAAVQYLPSLEYTRLSVRAAASYDRLAHGFPFRDLVGLVVPGLTSLWSPLYVGLVPLLLAGLALARRPRGDTRFWAGLGLVALLLSFGGSLFVYPLFYLLVPGFNLFQSQERAALLVSFSLAMLAGMGAVRRRTEAASASGGQNADRRPQTADGGQPKRGGLQSFILHPLSSVFRLPSSVLAAVLVALTALDLWRVAAPLLVGPPLPPDLGYPMALVAPAQAAPGRERVENEYRLPANWGMLAGVEDTWGASPLRTQRYADFYAGVPPERRRRLLNVGLLLTWHDAGPGLSEMARLPVKNPVTGAPETTFLLQTAPGPRAWFVAQAERVDDAAALARLADPGFDPWRVALLAPETPAALQWTPPLPPPLAGEGGIDVSAVEIAPGHLAYDLDAPADGLLVLSEVWYPGWQAAVDGQPAPLLRAHLTLMAVPVSAGPRHVELRFDPPLVRVGLVVSGVVLVVTLAGLAVGWRAQPRGE